MPSRSLTGPEESEARRVFKTSIFLGRVEISDGLGFGERPYTSVGLSVYTLHLGPDGFKDAISPRMRSTFIHELTHVWQGQHDTLGFGYMIESVISQGKSLITSGSTDGAYNYTVGKDWTDYNVEQQAEIVEDWYAGGMPENSAAFRYIRDNIRPGKN